MGQSEHNLVMFEFTNSLLAGPPILWEESTTVLLKQFILSILTNEKNFEEEPIKWCFARIDLMPSIIEELLDMYDAGSLEVGGVRHEFCIEIIGSLTGFLSINRERFVEYLFDERELGVFSKRITKLLVERLKSWSH